MSGMSGSKRLSLGIARSGDMLDDVAGWFVPLASAAKDALELSCLCEPVGCEDSGLPVFVVGGGWLPLEAPFAAK